MQGVYKQKLQHLNFHDMDCLVFALWAWAALSILWSVVPFLSGLNLVSASLLPLIYFYTRFSKNTISEKQIFTIFVGFGLVLSFGAVVQVTTGVGTFITQASWPFTNPNALALCIVMSLVMALSCFDKVEQSKISIWAALSCLTLGFMLTGSRAALVGLFIVMIALVITKKHLLKPALVILCLIEAISIFLFLFKENIAYNTTQRIFSVIAYNESALSTRPLIWQKTIELIAEHPLIGTGLASFAPRYQAVQLPNESSAGQMAHNEVLQIALELGLPGLVLLLGVFMVGMQLALKSQNTSIHSKNPYILASLALVGFFALVDYPLHTPAILMMTGLLLAHLVNMKASKARIRVPDAYPVFFAIFITGFSTAMVIAHLLTAQAIRVSDVNLTKANQYLQFSSYLDFGLNPDRPRTLAIMLLYAMDPLTTSKDERDKTSAQIEKLFDRARTLNPYDGQTDLYQATVNMSLFRPAEQNFQDALLKSPRLISARYLLADLYARQGRTEEAVKILEKGLFYTHPYDQMVIWFPRLAVLANRLGRPDLAQTAEKKLLNIPKKP